MTEELQIYRLIPNAPLDDPNWQNSPPQGEVVVRAYSTGDARHLAAQAEGDFLQTAAAPGEGVSTLMASAFRNEKLYAVVVDTQAGYDCVGPRGILEGLIAMPILDNIDTSRQL